MATEFYYNSIGLHELGEISVRRQADEYAATDLPQQKVVKLVVRLDFFQQNWADNYQLVETLRAALRTPHTRVEWRNENGQVILNQPVTLSSCDLPEDPNAWGTRHQQANFEFSYVVHDLLTNALTATVGSMPGGLVLGRVLAWKEALMISRQDELHPERKRSAYQIVMSGTLPGDMALDQSARQTQLLAAKTALLAKINQKQVRVAYGDFDRIVRVTNFEADVNQAVREVEWRLQGEFSLFPDETNYALGDYLVVLRDEGADQFLTLTGRIAADSKTRAETKLAAIVATVLSSYGFSADRVMREETGANHAISGTDGDVFLELPFSREYRRPLANVMTFTKAGAGSPITLGNVTAQADAYAAERYHRMRDQRSSAQRRVRFTGQYLADATQTLAQRKQQLEAQKAVWMASVNSKSGQLVYGDFNQNVRVAGLEVEIDHAVRVMGWSFTAEFTAFPDEANYATVEFTTTVRDEGADQFLTFSGRIQANDEAKARAKLATLRNAVLSSNGYSKSRVVREESTPSQVEADADGAAFLELSFSEEYRKPLANLLSFTREGGGGPVLLGNVVGQRDGYAAERAHPMRDQRVRASRAITFTGQYFANATSDMETRKAELKAQRESWMVEVNKKNGVMVYGDFNQTVRVVSLDAEIDHAVRALGWSITAEFTVFPDEANYAIVEFTATVRDEGADQFLTFSGRIQANSEAKARTKLATLRTSVLGGSGYSKAFVVREESAPAQLEADTDGSAFMELAFTEEYRKPLANALTYEKTGGSPVTLSNVTLFKQGYQAQRYSPLRSERSYAGGTVAAQGIFYVDAAKPIEDRRVELQALQTLWKAAFNSKDGQLVHGDFNQVVRVSEFEAEIAEDVRSLHWTLGAEYTVFPNEAEYALVQYTTTLREDKENGQVTLLFSGRIGAHSEAAAVAKLNTLRTAVLGVSAANYTQKKKESKAEQVDGNDGAAFIELGFDEEYELGASDIVRWQMNVVSAEDVAAGMIRQTWTGSVTSRAADFAAAEAKAKAKARALGDNKAQFKKNESITVEDRQTVTTGERLVTVSFTFEYQVRGVKVFMELSSETNGETFGETSEQVGGFVVAQTKVAATNAFNSILAEYNGELVRNKRTSFRYEKMSSINLSNGTVQAGLTEQFARLDFGFTVAVGKEANQTAMQYEMDVSVDDATNTRTITISGTVWAKDEETNEAGGLVRPSGKRTKAEKVLNDFLTGFNGWLGVRQRLNVRESVDLFLGQTNNTTDDIRFTKALAFTASYEKALTTSEQILQCQLTERVEHSGTRWVAQAIPSGRTLMQNCGIKEGSRVVRGSVTATTLNAAMTWAKAQRALLDGDYENPPSFDTSWEFPPKTTGVHTGGGANFKLTRVDFQFGETLPDFDFSE